MSQEIVKEVEVKQEVKNEVKAEVKIVLTKEEILKLYGINCNTMRFIHGTTQKTMVTTKGPDVTKPTDEVIYFIEDGNTSIESIDDGVLKINKYMTEADWRIYESAEVVAQVKPEWFPQQTAPQPEPTVNNTSNTSAAETAEIKTQVERTNAALGVASAKMDALMEEIKKSKEAPVPVAEEKDYTWVDKYLVKGICAAAIVGGVYFGYKWYSGRSGGGSDSDSLPVIDESLYTPEDSLDSAPVEII